MFLGQDRNLQVWKAVKAHELEASDWFNHNLPKHAKKGCAFTSVGVASAFHLKVMSGQARKKQCQELNGWVFTKRQWKRISRSESLAIPMRKKECKAEKTTLVPSQASFSSSSSISAGCAMWSCRIARFTACLQSLNSGNRTWVSSVSNCGAGSAASGSGACGSAAPGSCAFCTLAHGWSLEPVQTVFHHVPTQVQLADLASFGRNRSAFWKEVLGAPPGHGFTRSRMLYYMCITCIVCDMSPVPDRHTHPLHPPNLPFERYLQHLGGTASDLYAIYCIWETASQLHAICSVWEPQPRHWTLSSCMPLTYPSK